MRIGLRAHDLAEPNYIELCKQLDKHDIRCIQLALPKVIDGFYQKSIYEREKIVKDFANVLNDYGITTNVLGCYINPSERDVEKLNKQRDTFFENIEYAKIINAQVIGTETGSLNPDGSYNPLNHQEDAYQYVMESISLFVDRAKNIGVNVGVEAVWQFVIHDVNSVKRMLDDISSPNLKVIFDPVNMLCYDNHHQSFEIFKDVVDTYLDRISVLHLKDYSIQNQAMQYGVPYSGQFNFARFINMMKDANDQLDFIVEETSPNNVSNILRQLRSNL